MFAILSLATFCIVLAVRIWLRSPRRRDAPPVVPYKVPFIGCALDLGKDPDGFLKRSA
jgi:hypothetical protein